MVNEAVYDDCPQAVETNDASRNPTMTPDGRNLYFIFRQLKFRTNIAIQGHAPGKAAAKLPN
jgi:hypothetical protein